MPEYSPRARMRRVPARAVALVAATLTLFGTSVALAPAALAATGVTLTAPASVTVGDTVTVTIAADAGADLFAYDLTVGYDPALLEYAADSPVFPAGGFSAVTEFEDALGFTDTRLGTSPGLTGAQDLITFSFIAIADGTVTLSLSDATFIDSASASTTLPAAITSDVVIAALPVESPSPSPSASASTPPVVDDTTSASGSGSLATTGVNAAPWVLTGAVALAIVAVGAVLIIRRRKEATR